MGEPNKRPWLYIMMFTVMLSSCITQHRVEDLIVDIEQHERSQE